jgi:hypothetical protein
LSAAADSVKAAGRPVTLYIMDEFPIDATAGDLTIKANSPAVTITNYNNRPAKIRSLVINSGNKVDIRGDVTIDRNKTGTAVSITSSTLKMYSGVKIRGGYTTISSNVAGGVYVSGSSTFNMYGGEISNNISSGILNDNGEYIVGGYNTAGGVYVSGSSATFNMYGGEISNNKNGFKNSTSAGGVYVSGSSATFNMSGGTISNNNQDTPEGGFTVAGGVRLVNNSIFNMSGGTITGNTGGNYGGGVHVAEGSVFNMSGGTICNNKGWGSDAAAGGVAVYSTGTFMMSGNASITGNESKSSACGVALSGINATFIMEGGEISNNNKGRYGGVYLLNNGSFEMKSGTITGNQATTAGGVIVGNTMSTGAFKMKGGEITGNTPPDVKINNGTWQWGGLGTGNGTVGVWDGTFIPWTE